MRLRAVKTARPFLAVLALCLGLQTAPGTARAGADAYLGEIAMFGIMYAPLDWMDCSGQLLPIAQYSALFALLGTQYGGDGQTSFGLPDLRGRVPMGQGQGSGLTNRRMGQMGGSEVVYLNAVNLPAHTHTATTTLDGNLTLRAYSGQGDTAHPDGAVLAMVNGTRPPMIYSTEAPNISMDAASITGTATTTIGSTGGSQYITNLQPYTVVRFCICTNGLWPSQN